MRIPITKAIFDDTEKEAIIKPLTSGWLVQGPEVKAFEKLFADFTASSFASATTSCTTALHLGLLAMDIKESDAVIVPSFTYVASANAVEYTGARVIFCDIDLGNFNLDLNHIEYLLKNEKNVKAIMPVHLFGLCADMHAVMVLANQYGVKIIEDAACAFDAWIGNQHAGTFGDCGCFSFHPRKSITTGEGGMLITQSEAIASQVSKLRDHGASKSDLTRHKEKGGSLLPDFTVRGYNYRMTDLQGALGVAQMQKAAHIMAGRRAVAKKYDMALANVMQLVLPKSPKNYLHGYQSYVCLFKGTQSLPLLDLKRIDQLNVQRNYFMEILENNGIATRQGTHAVHTLTYYKERYALKDTDYLMAYAADRLSITLPLYADMTDQEFDYVIQNIHEALNQCAEFAA